MITEAHAELFISDLHTHFPANNLVFERSEPENKFDEDYGKQTEIITYLCH